MAMFPSLPADPNLLHMLGRFPTGLRPMMQMFDAIMRGPSPLSAAEREYIATFVSHLNSCSFCEAAHDDFTKALGEEVDTERLKPLTIFVEKLTLTPAQLGEADAQAVYAAGFDEAALASAVYVCAAFSFMNRVVEAAGITASGYRSPPKAMLTGHKPYEGLADLIGVTT